MKRTLTALFDLLLITLIAVGLYYRFTWVNWNEDADLHPDEYGLTGTISSLSVPKSLEDYFNTRVSSLSPYNKYDWDGQITENGPDNRMRWGQWPIILFRLAAEATGNTGYGEIRILGRHLSALADALSLLVLFLVGRKLYGYRAGLLATAFSALAVMQIQQSHFMTADNIAVLFAMLCLSCTVGAAFSRFRWLWYALAGIFLGMTVAARINLVVLAGIIFLAALINIYQANGKLSLRIGRAGIYAILNLMIAAVLAIFTFRLVQPMSFRAPTGDTTWLTTDLNPDWVESMKVAQNESNGIHAGPPGEQWTDRPILVFPFVNLVVWGMGPLLGLATWAGFGWTLWRFINLRGNWQAHLLPLAWVGGLFLFMGTRHVMSMRYFLPIYPFLCLFAAWGLLELFETGGNRGGQRKVFPILPALVTVLIVLGTFAWATAFTTAVYRHENTRLQATRWIFQNIPALLNLKLDVSGQPYNLPISAPDTLTITPDSPYTVQFSPQKSGKITQIFLPRLASLESDRPADRLIVVVSTDPGGVQALARAEVPVMPAKSDLRGEPSSGDFSPVMLQADQTYYLTVSLQGSNPTIARKLIVANENWDESLPVRMEGYDPFGQFYTGFTMEVRWPDSDEKRQMYREAMTQVDYLILPSQRSIWSISRLPDQYPTTMNYYRALFDGKLGFEQVALFQAPWRIGSLYISDLAGSVAWGRPPDLPLFNFNLFAAEEAFTVYDHAPVWIFKKRTDFNLQAAWGVFQ